MVSADLCLDAATDEDAVLAAIVQGPDEHFPFRRADRIAELARLPEPRVATALDRLQTAGLVLRQDDGLFAGAVFAVTIEGLARAWRAVLAAERA